MNITADILAQMPRPTIQTVTFYKRDEITTDLICCEVEADSGTWTFHEEAAGWDDLIAYLGELPGFRADWYSAVAVPPFQTCKRVAFKRR